MVLLLALLVAAPGCASHDWVTCRKAPRNPLVGPLRLLSDAGPQATPRTEQFLRQSDLQDAAQLAPHEMLAQLQERVADEPTPDGMYAIAELAYIEGFKAQQRGDKSLALDMYSASVAHAYMYLLDERFAASRNAYDPQYRRACELYNTGLEGTLRIVTDGGRLRPGEVLRVTAGQHEFDVQVAMRGRWNLDEIERFEFASDYEVNGLVNHNHTFGLGVPLIAIRKTGATSDAVEQFYPPGVTLPITAFLRVNPHRRYGPRAEDEAGGQTVGSCVLELYDPLDATEIVAENRRVPLESDLSVPLAYFLNQPAFREGSSRNIAYLGFLNPNAGQQVEGLYMLEPYDPKKIPVVLVHGLASSPVTWTDMYNDLRSDPDIRKSYQFWFYFYPTGQPFWVSGQQFRRELADALAVLDPQGDAQPLDQIVLVGHSMGGLVSRLQTLDSREDYWHLVSDASPEELQG
ncbi:MAG: hypothetical protein KDA41_20995, partial [Planctomycetales bacterium]|nr:hypothetical protein [Planctomycetales bacterium]